MAFCTLALSVEAIQGFVYIMPLNLTHADAYGWHAAEGLCSQPERNMLMCGGFLLRLGESFGHYALLNTYAYVEHESFH